MKKIKEKLRNLYSVHDNEDKSIALILALSQDEARKIWHNKENHELIFKTKNNVQKVQFKELQKDFPLNRLGLLLSEKRITPGISFICTKLSRYYMY